MEEPQGYADAYDLRQYASFVVPMLNNLEANPSVRQGTYAHVAVQCMVTGVDGTQLALLDSALAKAATLDPPMPIYPGLRIFPGSLAQAMDRTYWQGVADNVAELARHRRPGDRRMGFDAENYGDGAEATVRNLLASGYTQAQFRAAIQPLLDTLRAHGVLACIYPQVAVASPVDVNDLIAAMVDTLGPAGVEVWWEDSFGSTEDHRQAPRTDWLDTLVRIQLDEADLERHLGINGLKHRHVTDDDILRNWGSLLANGPINSMGSIRPWIFDNTRLDRALAGTPEWQAGTSLRTVNDVAYAWVMAARETVGPYSTGMLPSLQLAPFRGSQGTIAAGPCVSEDLRGMLLDPPAAFTVAELRAAALPTGTGANTWLLDFTFQLPPGLTSDTPILSQSQYNFGYWQVYLDVAHNKLVLQLAESGGGSTQFDVLPGPVPRGTDVRIQVGREGDRGWVTAAPGGPVSHVTAAFTVRNSSLLVVGAGLEPATFALPASQASTHGMVLKSLNVWHRMPTDVEITQQVHTSQYPWGRGL